MNDSPHSNWNTAQRELRRLLESGQNHARAMALFLKQHAQLHAADMAGTESWSYEDELLDDISDAQFRGIPPKGEHSVAWALWHIARIEDVAMNLLVADSEQVFSAGSWQEKLNSPIVHTGNEMSVAEIGALSVALDLGALRDYRKAVGQRTRQVAAGLKAEQMSARPTAAQLQRVWDEKAVLPEAYYVVDYWSKRKVATLLLMPPTRHLFVHLNEAAEIKRQL
jgi:hypothetical protein